MMHANEIARRLDFDRSGKGWRGRCPSCGYPGAALLSSRGYLRCVSCEDRDGLSVIIRDLGFGIIPKPGSAPVALLPLDERIRRAMVIWNGADPATGTPADVYLTARGLPGLAASRALRFRLDVPHPNPDVRARIPAMVALVVDAHAKPVAVHRTYLSRSGHKADVDPVRAAKASIWGAAVRLNDPIPGQSLVIGEGIETAASAGLLMGFPAWAAISAGNLERGLVLPPDIQDVVIAADPDPPGERAARCAALRWEREGRRVRIARPRDEGDFNDLLRRSRA